MGDKHDRGKIRQDGPDYRATLPALAVLPYFCIPHGTVTAEFGAGMSLAVTTALASIDGLHVISAASTMRFAGSKHPRLLIARMLKVRYLLTGQIAQFDQTLTFAHRLLDADTGEAVALSSIEVPLGRLQDVESGVLPQVIAAVLPGMREADRQRALDLAPESLTAHESLIRGIIAMHTLTRESHDRAEKLLLAAQRRARGYASAYAWHARLISIRIGQGWAADRQEACAQALDLAATALKHDPRNALALATAGHLHSYLKRDVATGRRLLDEALLRCPNEPLAWLLSGMSLAYVGLAREGCRHAEYALSLSPFDPCAYMYHSFLGACAYADGNYEKARHHSQLSLTENPNYSTTYRVLAASLVALGDIAAARTIGARLLQLEPNYPDVAEQTVPFVDPIQRNLYLTHLQTAGVLKTFRRRPPEVAA